MKLQPQLRARLQFMSDLEPEEFSQTTFGFFTHMNYEVISVRITSFGANCFVAIENEVFIFRGLLSWGHGGAGL